VAAVPGTNRYLGTQYRPTNNNNNNNNNKTHVANKSHTLLTFPLKKRNQAKTLERVRNSGYLGCVLGHEVGNDPETLSSLKNTAIDWEHFYFGNAACILQLCCTATSQSSDSLRLTTLQSASYLFLAHFLLVPHYAADCDGLNTFVLVGRIGTAGNASGIQLIYPLRN
jgi:hypothetical protein